MGTPARAAQPFIYCLLPFIIVYCTARAAQPFICRLLPFISVYLSFPNLFIWAPPPGPLNRLFTVYYRLLHRSGRPTVYLPFITVYLFFG